MNGETKESKEVVDCLMEGCSQLSYEDIAIPISYIFEYADNDFWKI